MKNIAIVIVVSTLSLLSFAEPSGDRPDATHAWAVHDVNRPDPVRVTVPQGGLPSDAIVLFDGSAASIEKNWRGKDGSPCQWKVADGAFVCVPGSGNAYTAEKFADCQLHVEFMTPLNDVEGWGNSGVFLMSGYEIQILDSSAVEPSRSPWKPANYADGQVGAVYAQHPPLVNSCRKPGEWQSYDIVFHPPVRDGKRLVDPGSLTVFLNGVLVQDAWPLEGKTEWCRRAKAHVDVAEAPLRLQDHGHPVPFRNIWIRRIPSRYAETTCGGPGVKRGDVAALRHKLAGESLAFAEEAKDPAEKFIRLWESYCYEPSRATETKIPAVEAACIAGLDSGTGYLGDPRHYFAFRRFVMMLVKDGWLAEDAAIVKKLESLKDPPKPSAPNMRDF